MKGPLVSGRVGFDSPADVFVGDNEVAEELVALSRMRTSQSTRWKSGWLRTKSNEGGGHEGEGDEGVVVDSPCTNKHHAVGDDVIGFEVDWSSRTA